MARSISWNGTTYSIPETGEENWGGTTGVDGLIYELANTGLQRSGGSFTLTGDIDFGGTAGLKSTYYKSRGTVSTAGIIRLANAESIGWRNAANSANLELAVDSSNRLTYAGTVVLSSSGIVQVAAGGTGLSSYTSGDLVYASASTTLSKLAIGSAGQSLVVSSSLPAWGVALIAGGGTGLSSYTAGDTLYYASSTALSKLAIGTANYCMTSSGTAPQWGLLVNANIDAAAAITRSKIASGTAGHVLINDGSGVISSEATLAKSRGGCAADMSSVTFPSSGTIATIAGTQVLTNKDIDGGTAANTSRITIPKDTLANITALTRKEGTVWYATDTDKLYKDDGTSLTEIGSGSSGSINYISNPDAESGVTGWAAYADAAGTSPVDGTGGSPTVTITRTTTTPLRGTGSFLLTKDAANRQGEGVGYAFTIDSADKAKVLNISFDYEIASGTFVSGDSSDIRVFIYDVTNSVLIAVTPYTIQGGSSNQWKFTGTFQTASNSTSYRLILHCATTSASAYAFEFDNVVVGPQSQLYGAPISDWTAFTPTGSWSTNTTYSGFWRRVGDSMEVTVLVSVSGAPTAASLTVNLPTGYTIDTAKLAGGADTNNRALGKASILDSGTAIFVGFIGYSSTSAVSVQNVDDAASGVAMGAVSNTNPMTFASGDAVFIEYKVPISGWSSTVLMSNDTDTRVVAMRASGNPASATSGNPIIFPTADFDTHSAYNTSTGRYTAPVSGFYRVHGLIKSATNNVDVSCYVDAAQVIFVGYTDSNGECAYTGTVRVTAGQVIDIRPGGTLDAETNSTLHIERISGPSAIAATESVNALYETDQARSITNNAATTGEFLCEDRVFDSHNAYNTSTAIYTVPTSGKYRVGASALLGSGGGWEAGEVAQLTLYKNGSSNRDMASIYSDSTHGQRVAISGSTIVSCVAGDTLEVRIFQDSDGSISTVASSQRSNWVSFERIGN
jgi:hypothetical protein